MDVKAGKTENFEVTGISRSGRVRKKSSKLMDFESPDEVEYRKRKSDTPVRPDKAKRPAKTRGGGRNDVIDSGGEEDIQKMMSLNAADDANSDTDRETYNIPNHDPEDDNEDEDDDEDDDEDLTYEHDSMDEEDDDDELNPVDNDDDDDDDSDYKESALVVDEKTPSQSLYLAEKNRRKSGRGSGLKAHRKDKGKARFTAYMMWAKEVRQELSRQHHDMDFTTMARRLSELWATVPKRERELWKREARKASMNYKAKAASKPEAPLMPSRKFINKKGGPIAPPIKTATAITASSTTAPSSTKSLPVNASATQSKQNISASALVDLNVSPSLSVKKSGIAPVDAAAHLKLLGESLSIIGERLQEHEGQIAVSGSMSVLLDSLLCAIGPLLCLTQNIDFLRTNEDTFSNILHNIAYIMPGIG